MKKMKQWLLLLCLALGLTGCDSVGEILNEVIQSGVLDEYLWPEKVQKIEVPDGEMEVHFIDVGQADCALLSSGGHFMLIDGGNNDDAEHIVTYLQNAGVKKLDMVVGTHPHEDHIGSLDAAIEAFDIGAVYMPDVSADTETYRDVLDAVKGKGLQVQHPVPGDVLDFNGLPVEIFGPVKEYSNLNNHSIVLRVSVGETAFLFTGDVEIEGEYDILEQGFDISADVLKVSHHGSSGSSVEEFLAYIDADYAVISVGEGNIYDHPEAVTLKRLQNYGMEIYRTDEQGTIVCDTDGKNISFRQERESKP
ncbi:MAG: MBL fold metallo-hydrolase [Anaerotignum sp.]|nr:MBL fold metallo-hydrolase [Anaerotignum sp.]